jgi:uncharacterized protein YjbI with pentapeptide repeats
LISESQDANFGTVTIWRDNLQEDKPNEVALRGADLQEAILQRAQRQRAQLPGAHLWKADLRWAQLQEATLKGADLKDAHLWGAQLQGTDLTEVANLTQDQINQTCTDASTKLPQNLIKPPPCPPYL